MGVGQALKKDMMRYSLHTLHHDLEEERSQIYSLVSMSMIGTSKEEPVGKSFSFSLGEMVLTDESSIKLSTSAAACPSCFFNCSNGKLSNDPNTTCQTAMVEHVVLDSGCVMDLQEMFAMTTGAAHTISHQ